MKDMSCCPRQTDEWAQRHNQQEHHHYGLPLDGRAGGSIGQRQPGLQGVVPVNGQRRDGPGLALCFMLHQSYPMGQA